MKKIVFFIVFFLTIQIAKSQNMDYQKVWKKVDDYTQKEEPKSALKLVNQIYEQAKQENNQDQLLKAYLYKESLPSTYTEDYFAVVVNQMESDVKTMDEPNASLLHSILAKIYWQYYERNSWSIDERTSISGELPEDVNTWSTRNFIDRIVYHYNKSLENKELLQKTPASFYTEMIKKGNIAPTVRPTLFDILSASAVDFYQNSTAGISRPADYFEINSDIFFADAQTFVNQQFKTDDTLSFQYNGVIALQNWLKFRLSDTKNKDALIDADLKRIDFVKKYSVLRNTNELYEKALLDLLKKYPAEKQSIAIYDKLSEYYYDLGQTYSATKPETFKYKDYLKKAIEYSNKIIDNFDKDKFYTPRAKNRITNITQKFINFTAKDTYLPNVNFPVLVDFKNVNTAYISVRSIGYRDYYKIIDQYNKNDLEIVSDLFKKSVEVYSKTVNLPKTDDYQNHSTEVVLDGLPDSCYLVYIADNSDFNKANTFAYNLIKISEFGIIKKSTNNGYYEGYVVDTRTSKPLKDVKVKIYKERYRKPDVLFKTEVTDENGYFNIKLKNDERYYVDLNYKGTIHHHLDYFSYYEYHSYPTVPTNELILITDRSIYRPGQTVYFKGILLSPQGEDRNVVPNEHVDITIRDANYTEIFSETYTTNEFGSFTGHFVIPKGSLNGTFYIFSQNGRKSFQVEEYKRPQFFVNINNPSQQYIVNQEVEITGNAENYSGVKLNDATVSYDVVRTSRWTGWWWWRVPTEEIHIADGTVTTDENGNFSFKFKARPDLTMPQDPNTVFDYKITVDVTDINGETQSASLTVSVGYTAMTISTSLPAEINLSDIPKLDSIKISAKNLNNEDVDAVGKIEIFSLKKPDKPLLPKDWEVPDLPLYSHSEWQKFKTGIAYRNEDDYRYWEKGEKVWTTNFDTKKSHFFDASGLKKLTQGVYKIEIISKDIFGNDVKKEEFLEIYDEKSKKIAYPSFDFNKQLNSVLEPGETAKFLIATSFPTTYLMEVKRGDEVIDKKFITLKKDEQKLIKIPVKEEYRGGFSVHFLHYSQGKSYKNSFYVSVPYSNKKLKIKFATFRDNLQPGEKEQWKIYIENPDGTPADAELLTFMYDASLDALMPYSLYFSPFENYFSSPTWDLTKNSTKDGNLFQKEKEYYYSYSLSYPYIDMFGLDFWYSERVGYRSGGIFYSKSKAFTLSAEEAPNADEFSDVDLEETSMVQTKGIEDTAMPQEPQEEVQIRKNFAETAFFYPQLQTDSTGKVIVSFTVPESLTKWHIWGLAHTPDLKYVQFEKFLKTQKKLMVMPNAPRFFRQGDTLYFATKVSNLSDKDLTGTVSLEFIDDITEKTVAGIIEDTKNKSFSVKAQQSTVVTWKIVIPDDAEVLTYRVIAKSGDFSDGEQKTLPVLTNRILVMETMPLPVRPLQQKTFTFEKLVNSQNSSSIKNYRLTVEFTSNPAWYAVQALPYLVQYPYDCNEQTFSKLYANSLASYIANSSPKIKAVFDRWKNYEPEALFSNLEKNQELKSALLEETPWVLDAKSETQQKRNLALLFDLNTMANQRATALHKLKKNQLPNGGWSWFSGMEASQWVTQYIVEGTGHLLKLGVIDENDEMYDMSEKAIGFIDNEMKKDYDYLKKHLSKKSFEEYQPSATIVHYFYARSFYNVPLPKRYREAYDYFYSHMVEHIHDYPLYTEGLITLTLMRNGQNDKLVKEMLKSFKERAATSEEMGMYWKTNKAGYFWYQNPIQTQTLMIELFNEAGDTATVDELKIWLLKNKQTNQWNSTVSTAEAIYALLLTGGTDLLAESDIIPVQLGDTLIDPANNPDIKTESGTGYYKVSFSGNEVKPQMGNITVNNTNNVVTWGGVYWQYFEDIDKITAHETNLKIKKELFKEITDATGKKLQRITDQTPLQIGDFVVVRMVITTDRDMEFVHIKDMRASGFEPVDVISGYKWRDGLGYYQETKDASMNFFIDFLPKGTYVFEYRLKANNAGSFSNGITTIQCMYAPEFTSHSKGLRVKIENK